MTRYIGPSGAGSQLASFALPGESFCRYSVNEPSGFFFIDGSIGAAIAFSFLFGVGNGLLTITRGTVPLQLFDARHYGSIVGRLIAPGFYLAASAPVVLAWVIETRSAAAAAWLMLLLSAALSVASLILRLRVRRPMRQ